MTRRPKPLLPTTTALSNKHDTEIRSNILISLVFAVGLASGASGFAPMSVGQRPQGPSGRHPEFPDHVHAMSAVLRSHCSYYQYLRHARKSCRSACGRPLAQVSQAARRPNAIAEKELLYPPLTFLQPTGWSMEHSVGGVKFTVIEVEPFAG